MSYSSPSAPANSSRIERTGSTNASSITRNPVRYAVASFKRAGSIYSGILPRSPLLADEERATTIGHNGAQAHPPAGADSDQRGAGPLTELGEPPERGCPILFILAVPWVLIVFVFFSIIAIAAIASTSFLLSVIGVTLLGLTRASGSIYTNLALVSLIVATFCGAAIITAAGAALILLFLPLSMCCGDDVLVALACTIAIFGGTVATFFAPAIGIAVTDGDIIGLSPAFGTTEAMRMNGVGLGGLLAIVLAELIFSGIAACLEIPEMW